MNERFRAADVNRLEGVVVEALATYQNKISTPAQAEDIGRLSSEAVVSDYEVLAKAFEEMGDEIKSRAKNLEAALVDADNDLKYVGETMAAIRERGKLVQVQIEEIFNVSKHARTVCDEFFKKING